MIRFAFTAETANAIADEMIASLEGTDWEVCIRAPMFPGDRYTISVG